MRTVRLILEDDLVKSVDRIAKTLHTTRAAFTRKALREAIHRFQARCLEEQPRKGYRAKPVTQGEFDVWEKEQGWGDRG